MTDEPAPYVHDSVDRLDILPLLAHGANCVVFDCIGLLDASPIAPTAEDIAKYTCLSLKTVRTALAILLFNDLVEESEGRYRPLKYIAYRGVSRPDEPILPRPSDGKTFFPPMHDGSIQVNIPLEEEIHTCMTREKIFAEAFDLPNVPKLAEWTNSDEQARAWVDWVQSKPAGKSNPQGYAFWWLQKHPNTFPLGHKPERVRVPRFQGIFAEIENSD